jgi:hypothetical protein
MKNRIGCNIFLLTGFLRLDLEASFLQASNKLCSRLMAAVQCAFIFFMGHLLCAGFVENFKSRVPVFAGFRLHGLIAHAPGFFCRSCHWVCLSTKLLIHFYAFIFCASF